MSMTVTWTLGELIAKARKDAELEQKELAEASRIARTSLSNYETGRSVPPFDVMVRIASVCGVPLEWFAQAVNDKTATAEAVTVSVLSQHSVRPKRLELPTFWMGAGWTAEDDVQFRAHVDASLSVPTVEVG